MGYNDVEFGMGAGFVVCKGLILLWYTYSERGWFICVFSCSFNGSENISTAYLHRFIYHKIFNTRKIIM